MPNTRILIAIGLIVTMLIVGVILLIGHFEFGWFKPHKGAAAPAEKPTLEEFDRHDNGLGKSDQGYCAPTKSGIAIAKACAARKTEEDCNKDEWKHHCNWKVPLCDDGTAKAGPYLWGANQCFYEPGHGWPSRDLLFPTKDDCEKRCGTEYGCERKVAVDIKSDPSNSDLCNIKKGDSLLVSSCRGDGPYDLRYAYPS